MALIRAEQISGSVASASFAAYTPYAAYAVTASYVPGLVVASDRIINIDVQAAVNPNGTIFLIKSGSFTFHELDSHGKTTLTSDADTVFLIKNFSGKSLLTVSQSGVVIFATQSSELTGAAPAGGMYFTSSSFFVGLD